MNVPAVLRELAQAIEDGEAWTDEPDVSWGIPYRYGRIEFRINMTASFREGMDGGATTRLFAAFAAEPADPLPGIPK